MKKTLIILGLVLVILAGGVYVQHRRILVAVGSFLVSRNPLIHADGIAVLSGSVPYRILEGIDLYRRGFAPRIFLAPYEGNPKYVRLMKSLGITYQTDFHVNRRIALNRGVPAEAIEVLTPTGSTRNEAEVIFDYMRKKGWRSVIVVTSEFHSTRTRLIFRSLNRHGVKVAVHPSRHDRMRLHSWWRSRARSKQIFYEYVKLINHYTTGF